MTTGPWSKLHSPRGLRNLALTAAATIASATIGALVTTPESMRYAGLDKLTWQPPPIVLTLA